MIVQRLFSKILRDKHAINLAKEELNGMRKKQQDFQREFQESCLE